MKIKGKVNKEIAKMVYRTAEVDDFFFVLDRNGSVGVDYKGVGYLTDDVEELYDIFGKAEIDYMIRLASDVAVCPFCGRPLQRGEFAICRNCETKGKKRPVSDVGWANLANAVCIQAIKDYDAALDSYGDNPFSKYHRDKMLSIELWIAGSEWETYSLGYVDGKDAIRARQRAAKKRWEVRQKEKVDKMIREMCPSFFEEMRLLEEENEQLKKELHENSAGKRKGKQTEGSKR